MAQPKTFDLSSSGPPDWQVLLQGLVNLDRGSVQAYDQALHRLGPLGREELEEIRQRFLSFREDHSRHLRELNELLGLRSPTAVLRVVHPMTGGAPLDLVRVVHAHECEIVRTYTQSMNWDMDHLSRTLGQSVDRTREILARCRSDERRHLNYIERVLREITPGEPRGSLGSRRAA